ncbi:MAG: GIY-YIG nuclease family protein [Alphaproteobacteria bacterium]|nr:GIY-YIG nuclease family protein [Alphaproteobacteria bacterium]
MTKGIIYILTNPMFKDNVVKIGQTKNLEQRLKQLSEETGTPCPFECFAAFEVENYQKAEQFLHKVLHSTGVHTDKVHLKKEFYNLDPVVAYKNLKEMSELLGGHEIELNKDKAYDKEDKKILAIIEKQQGQKQKNFKFTEHGIPEGTVLTFLKDETLKCRVVANNKVEFNGKTLTISALTTQLMHQLGFVAKGYNGYTYWVYKGKLVSEY